MWHNDDLHVLGVHHVYCYRALPGGLASENIRGLRRSVGLGLYTAFLTV